MDVHRFLCRRWSVAFRGRREGRLSPIIISPIIISLIHWYPTNRIESCKIIWAGITCPDRKWQSISDASAIGRDAAGRLACNWPAILHLHWIDPISMDPRRAFFRDSPLTSHVDLRNWPDYALPSDCSVLDLIASLLPWSPRRESQLVFPAVSSASN